MNDKMFDLRPRLSAETFDAIMKAAYDLMRSTSPFFSNEDMCDLIEHLKLQPDCKEIFPKGKWATIQHLQSIVNPVIL